MSNIPKLDISEGFNGQPHIFISNLPKLDISEGFNGQPHTFMSNLFEGFNSPPHAFTPKLSEGFNGPPHTFISKNIYETIPKWFNGLRRYLHVGKIEGIHVELHLVADGSRPSRRWVCRNAVRGGSILIVPSSRTLVPAPVPTKQKARNKCESLLPRACFGFFFFLLVLVVLLMCPRSKSGG